MSNFNRNEVKAYNLGYRVNKNGELIGLKGNPVGSHSGGYYRIKIRENGKFINCLSHRLQAYQKYGNKIYQSGIVCRHLNGDSLDNSIDNIAIGTQSDNIMDRKQADRIAHASHASSFAQVHNHNDIISFYNKEKSYSKTMDKFNISSKGTLHYIINKIK
tara:strand:+ start:198 stop:677 length:480 start_codon:yes stop_codon:yes gene_type:complete